MFDTLYAKQKLYMVAILVILVCAFNLGLAALTGKDMLVALLGKRSIAINAIFLFAGVSALALGLYRDTYLPFLGPTVMPCSLLEPQFPEGADTTVRIYVRPGAKIFYWAAEAANDEFHALHDWKQAYLGFHNAGVAVADDDGYALLRVRKPQAYTVPLKGALDAHIHYRVCGDDGLMDAVRTVSLDGRETFENYVSRQESRGVLMYPTAALDLVQADTAQDTIATAIRDTVSRLE